MTHKEKLKEIQEQYNKISLLDRNAMKCVYQNAKNLQDDYDNSVYSDLDKSDLEILKKIMYYTNLTNIY